MNENLTSDSVWKRCLKVIRDNISPQSFKTWFEPIKAVKLEGKSLTIQVPSQFFYEWLEEHYVSLLQKALKQELGIGSKLEYNIIVGNGSGANSPYTINVPTNKNQKERTNELSMPLELTTGIRNPFIIPGLKKINIDSQLNPKYSFENFLEGDCNRLARSAGFAVANNPASLLLGQGSGTATKRPQPVMSFRLSHHFSYRMNRTRVPKLKHYLRSIPSRTITRPTRLASIVSGQD